MIMGDIMLESIFILSILLIAITVSAIPHFSKPKKKLTNNQLLAQKLNLPINSLNDWK
jgi:uncharacterized protein YpmB